MKKFLIALLLIVMMLGISIASTAEVSSEIKVHKIEKFLLKYPFSPLIGYEHQIVECSEKYGLDYRLYVAIAGCESTFGKRYLRYTNNLTGIGSGKIKYKSISDNIDATYKLIATKKYYWKYRKTKKIADLVYVYKGVPPWKQYIFTMEWIFDEINKQQGGEN